MPEQTKHPRQNECTQYNAQNGYQQAGYSDGAQFADGHSQQR